MEDAGNDGLDGGEGDDELIGGEGVDLVAGGLGVDVMDAGAGDDIVNGATAKARASSEETMRRETFASVTRATPRGVRAGGAGRSSTLPPPLPMRATRRWATPNRDETTCRGEQATLTGTEGPDTMQGTPGRERHFGSGRQRLDSRRRG